MNTLEQNDPYLLRDMSIFERISPYLLRDMNVFEQITPDLFTSFHFQPSSDPYGQKTARSLTPTRRSARKKQFFLN